MVNSPPNLACSCNMAALVVASHNILNGQNLRRLLRVYTELRAAERLHALCIQEAVPHAARRVAATLGRRYGVGEHSGAPRLAIVYDRARLRLRRIGIVDLPRLAAVPWWQRVYTSAVPEPKHALIGCFAVRGGFRKRPRRLVLANFHLDAAGDNRHRAGQIRALATALWPTYADGPLVACGDTNAFSLLRTEAEGLLQNMLGPLARCHRARDVHAAAPRDTHFFARAHEPKLGQRIAVALGRFGIDAPRRYDVIVAALRCIGFGTVDTPDSDHNIVWARLSHRRFRV
jgi:endonuclease/exonuclease/phosphatase family metal-dependent hydrolase